MQFHAVALLHALRATDRLAISKLVSSLTKAAVKSPLAQVCVRGGGAAASSAILASESLSPPPPLTIESTRIDLPFPSPIRHPAVVPARAVRRPGDPGLPARLRK